MQKAVQGRENQPPKAQQTAKNAINSEICSKMAEIHNKMTSLRLKFGGRQMQMDVEGKKIDA